MDSQPRFLDVMAELSARMATAPGMVEVLFGAAGALGPAAAAHLAGQAPGTHRLIVYVVADDDRLDACLADLGFFLGPGQIHDDPVVPPPVLALRAPEGSAYTEWSADRRAALERMGVLFRLSQRILPAALVVSAAALARKVIPAATFAGLCTRVTAGAHIGRDDLVAALVKAGLQRLPMVEDPGTFAVRGSVIDVFPPVYRHPVRLEFFGDEVETIRLFDGATQRTLRPLPVLHIHPAKETILSPGADPRERLLAAAETAAVPSSQIRQQLEQIAAGEDFFGIEALAPAFHDRMVPLFEYLPKEATLFVEDPDAVDGEVRAQFAHLHESAAHRRAEHRLTLDPGEFALDGDEMQALLQSRRRILLPTIEFEREGAVGESSMPQGLRLVALSNAGLRAELTGAHARHEGTDDGGDGAHGGPLHDRIQTWLAAKQRVRLVASNKIHADRLGGFLEALNLAPKIVVGNAAVLPSLLGEHADPTPLAIMQGTLEHGFRLPADHLVLVAEEEIFGARAHRAESKSKVPAIGALTELQPGDLVVHDDHGIGRYLGCKKLAVRGVVQDFLHLEYNGGTVYVPVVRIGLVHRFVGGAHDKVVLDKVGGRTWQAKRRRVSVQTRKLAEEMLQLHAQRRALPGHAFAAPDAVFTAFEETFPFDETPDQANAIAAVLADMQTSVPMDRLVCGDVGYGKTEVALRATLLAVTGGRQVAVLTPTTVLCEQHLKTFTERMANFPVRVGSLSRFSSRAEQRATVAALAAGRIDVVIGTHRLLSRDVRFKNLGLLVIDEEQRFGVTHKERIKEIRSQIDVLTLTATPIPRTLQMSMTGLREISIIATPPADRLAIRTFVCRWDESLLGLAVRRELGRGGQVFFVHNQIEDLEAWAAKVQALVPTARVAVAHGQMSAARLERVMVDFVAGKFDLLASTSIIESGLDIPRANTMIVNRADRFGLAQLYQIRGRIGRSRNRAFCYLVVPPEHKLASDARQRLAVLQRFTELGAGFQIATHDLEIRGAGELLGARQSGALVAVGFDAYAQLLEEAVAELRGQPIKREHDPEITVDVPSFLPDDYIPDTGQRLDLYRRLGQASDDDEVSAIMAEVTDRYGEPPVEARLLAQVMGLKTLVRRSGAVGLDVGAGRMTLSFVAGASLDPARLMRLTLPPASGWKVSPDLRLSHAFDPGERQDPVAAARARLIEVLECIG